jgi:hypothetical protein
MDLEEDGLTFKNVPEPKNRETAIMWEQQVLKALELP